MRGRPNTASLSHMQHANPTCSFFFLQDFLIDETEFVNGPEWKGLNPTLPIYI
jgi:hypothetical protein